MIIRQATIADARSIAEVHVHSWQWAYRGLLPDDYLDHLSVDRWTEARRQRLGADTEGRTWVAEHDGRIVGFAITGTSRDPDASARTGEIQAIYLRREAAGKGIGGRLLAHAIHDLWQRGYQKATLWVLETNVRARMFYEKAGWSSDGATKTQDRQGVLLHEVRYRVNRVAEDSQTGACRTSP